MSSILIIDDEAGVRASLGGVLRDEGYRVDAVESGEIGLDQVTRQAYDVILLDIWLPGSPPSPFGILKALLVAAGKLS